MKNNTKLLDPNSLQAKVLEVSDELHNLSCKHQNDDELSEILSSLSSRLYTLSNKIPPVEADEGMIYAAEKAATRCLIEHRKSGYGDPDLSYGRAYEVMLFNWTVRNN